MGPARDTRLPAHVEAAGLVRAVNAAGGFATVVARGDRDSGSLLVVCSCSRDRSAAAYERLPQPDGQLAWRRIREQDAGAEQDFTDYLQRRRLRDPDLWIVELDIPRAERFIESSGTID